MAYYYSDDDDDHPRAYTDEYIETFSKLRSDVLIKVFETFSFGIGNISMQNPRLPNLYQIVVSVKNIVLSDIQFSFLGDGSGSETILHIVKSTTPLAYRMLKLNSLLRVVLCKYAVMLNLSSITSNAMNVISAHSLCKLGFAIVKDHMKGNNATATQTCNDFAELGNIKDADNLSINVILQLKFEIKDGVSSLPELIITQFEKFVNDAKVMEGNAVKRIDSFFYFRDFLSKLNDTLNKDPLFQSVKVKKEFEIALGENVFKDIPVLYFSLYPAGKQRHSSKAIASIPFVFDKATTTLMVLSAFDIGDASKRFSSSKNLTFESLSRLSQVDTERIDGVSAHMLLLAVCCNACLALKCKVLVYLDPNNTETVNSLNGMGFEQVKNIEMEETEYETEIAERSVFPFVFAPSEATQLKPPLEGGGKAGYSRETVRPESGRPVNAALLFMGLFVTAASALCSSVAT
jgi:hypothetical protein